MFDAARRRVAWVLVALGHRVYDATFTVLVVMNDRETGELLAEVEVLADDYGGGSLSTIMYGDRMALLIEDVDPIVMPCPGSEHGEAETVADGG